MSKVFLLYGHERQQCFLSVSTRMYIVFVLLPNWGWDV